MGGGGGGVTKELSVPTTAFLDMGKGLGSQKTSWASYRRAPRIIDVSSFSLEV